VNPSPSEDRGVSDLVRDLLRAVLGLVRSTARMFGLEAREVARRLGRRIALLVISAVIAAAGAVLLLGGIALVAERALGLPRWAAFALAGAIALGAGALGIRAAIRGLCGADLAFPETVAELTKDIDALAESRKAPEEP